ncbi:MAG: hypothetical protein ACRC8S_19265 [Fimbriiglobus sp.]
MTNTLRLVILTLGGGLALAWPPSPKPTRPANTHELHNLYRIHARIWSGSSPDTEAAFLALRQMGVKTIISVDGANPHIQLAAKHGLRYVHLPIGYDGIPLTTQTQLSKAIAELPGPIYLHCHHGKHRGPTAAVTALVCLGEMTPEDALAWMHQAGTDRRYQGLYALPKTVRKMASFELHQTKAVFPAIAQTGDLTKQMVQVDSIWDQIRSPEATDESLRRNAVLLQEHFREAQRLPSVRDRGTEFLELFAAAEAAAKRLEAKPTRDEVRNSQAHCQRCHDQHRN